MKISPNGFREYDARWLFEKDIDLDKVYVITSNYNYKDSHLKHIHFEYYEYAMQQIVFKNGN